MQDNEPQLIKYKNPVSNKWKDPDFGAIIVDNRQKKVELIREVPGLKDAYSPRLSNLSRSNSIPLSKSGIKTPVPVTRMSHDVTGHSEYFS